MILIKSATIVTQNEKREILKGDILINNDRIEEVGKGISEKAELIIDGTNKIAIPGLINAHTHIPMAIFRGYGEGLPLKEWLQKRIWPAEAKLTRGQVYYGSLLGMVESIRSGVATFNEMYIYHVNETARAAAAIGMRVAISRAMLNLVPGREREDELAAATAFLNEWKGKSPYIIPTVSCHAPYSCSDELLIKAKGLAKKEKLKFHIHISETREEVFDILKKTGKHPFEYLDSLGLLDADSIIAHAVMVSAREIKLAGKRKVSIAHCPVSNLKLATGGICPITEFDEAGSNVTIGTDGAASNNSLNMFESMKVAALLQKHHYWKADAMPAQRIFDFATINGARALGINAGSIRKGKLADIVLLDARMPNLIPQHDLISNLVYAAGPQNVTDVIVNGRIAMQNREIKTVREEEVLSKASELARELR